MDTSATPETPVEDERPRGHPRRWVRVVAAVAAVVLVTVGVLVVVEVAREASRKVPAFPSLVAHPDPQLKGTVAYFAADGCVHVVQASGTGDRSVHCLPQGQDPEEAKRLGKLIGPQLRWRDDGRLEVTMFRMPMGPQGEWGAGYQQLVDVATGAVEDVPVSEAPTTPTNGSDTAVASDGRTATIVSKPDSGHAEVRVRDADGSTRTVLSARGPRFYAISSLEWSPDGRWIAADDGRILVIDPGPTPTTRILVKPADNGFGAENLRFAVTDRAFTG